MKQEVNIFWFRRDLRLTDNVGLYHALKEGLPVIPVFIFDRHILDELSGTADHLKADARLSFIHEALQQIQQQLVPLGSSLETHYGFPLEVFSQLLNRYTIRSVFTNHDYEPYARQRDEKVNELLAAHGVGFQTFKDQVIFEKGEVVKDDRGPYTVFTPYSRKWKTHFRPEQLHPYPTQQYWANFYRMPAQPIQPLPLMGFIDKKDEFPSLSVSNQLIQNYHHTRDYPSLQGTSRMGVHLRFGTISIRELTARAFQLNLKYLDELIWREFYQNILWHFPHVVERAFKPAYDAIEWRNNTEEFERWCKGQTGYPIVDAGMRELNATGYMHNRVRMITASFLTKHLLIDWRWGEAYFAEKLLDFDLASNNGGWQWAAGSGCDAAPYFRVFNPRLQTEKFDKELKYIRTWIPELNDFSYPKPIVDHDFARKRCLETYGKALKPA